MSAVARVTLETLVTSYRREVSRATAYHPELEVRLRLPAAVFAVVFDGMAAWEGERPAPAELLQTLSVLAEEKAGTGRRVLIREVVFERGVRQRDRYSSKWQLLTPVIQAGELPYRVALSAEQDAAPFAAPADAVLRVKARVSHHVALPAAEGGTLRWRVDLTLVRKVTGGALLGAASGAPSPLKEAVDAMFRRGATAATLLDALGARGSDEYECEAEVEFVEDGPRRDALRPADVTAAAALLLGLVNPQHAREAAAQAEVWRAARHVARPAAYLARFRHELGLKRLLPKALAITRADYRAIYPPLGFFLTDKADGQRALALVRDRQGVIVTDVLYADFVPTGAGFGAPGAPGGFGGSFGAPGGAGSGAAGTEETIVDGELLLGADGRPEAFLAFDVIAVAGTGLAGAPFEVRARALPDAVAILRAAGLPAAAKAYAHLLDTAPAALERAFREASEAPRPYRRDGLVLVEPGRPYAETRTFKWKPACENTIDFVVRRAPAALLAGEGLPPDEAALFADAPGHALHLLFVGVTDDMFRALGLRLCPAYAALWPAGRAPAREGSAHFPVQFSPSSCPHAYLYQHPLDSPLGAVDGAVLEMRCVDECRAASGDGLPRWQALRARPDYGRELLAGRYYGNDFRVAEIIWLNYVDPFPLQQLWEGASGDYFAAPKSGAFRAQTAFVSYAKTRRIDTLRRAPWVVDLAAGKGQDLGRYLAAGVRNLVAVDQDRAALVELVHRKFAYVDSLRRGRGGPAGGPAGAAEGTAVHVLVADLSRPAAESLARLRQAAHLPAAGADAVVCNLAVHYFLGSVEGLRNFVALAAGAVRPGGLVVLTCFFGELVHQLFAGCDSWELREGEAVKYSIRRLYASDTLEAAGQKIGVLLPFSGGQYYEEFLVNTAALTAAFADAGFVLAEKTGLASLLPDFEVRNRTVAAELTKADRRYIELLGELVYRREASASK